MKENDEGSLPLSPFPLENVFPQYRNLSILKAGYQLLFRLQSVRSFVNQFPLSIKRCWKLRSRVKGLIPRNSKITIPLADVIFMQMSRRGRGREEQEVVARFLLAFRTHRTFVRFLYFVVYAFYQVRKWVTGIKERDKNFFSSCLARRKIRCFEKFEEGRSKMDQSLVFPSYRCVM